MATSRHIHLGETFKQWQDPDSDTEIYEVRRAFELMADNNPNMMDLLYAPPEFWITSNHLWKHIYAHRSLFLSRQAVNSYIGYATSQLYRIERHRGWLLNPVEKKPDRVDFGLDEAPAKKVHIQAILSIPPALLQEGLQPKVEKEREFQQALENWKSYESWKIHRNAKRRVLEAKVGYDSKHAMHLIRLLLQGKEILELGEVRPNRTGIDAHILLEIRNCEWDYEKVMNYAKQLKTEIHEIEEKSKLQKRANIPKINHLLDSVYSGYEIHRKYGSM